MSWCRISVEEWGARGARIELIGTEDVADGRQTVVGLDGWDMLDMRAVSIGLLVWSLLRGIVTSSEGLVEWS